MTTAPQWEEISNGEGPASVWRMRVPGGWIYTVHHSYNGSESAVFVPEPPQTTRP
jgi:hypothetical protein